jgi:cobalt-zinc-cadmium efflux system outer membrane protein
MSSQSLHSVRFTSKRSVASQFVAVAAMCIFGWGAIAQEVAPALTMPPSSPAIPPAFDSLPQPESVAAKPVTLADLEQLALQNNPSLSVAWANVNSARGRQIQGGLAPNPTIGYLADDMGEDNSAGKQGGFVSQQFITGGKLCLNRAIGVKDVQVFQFRRDTQELRVLSDVRIRFYEALAAQRRMEMAKEISGIGQLLTKSTQQLFDSQQVSRSDLLQAEVEAGESDIVASNAVVRNDEAWRLLASVVGISANEPRPLDGKLDGDIPRLEWASSYARLVNESPELAAAHARVQKARLSIERARRENIPNVDVMASVGHRNQNDFDVAGVQVGIPIPLLDRNQGNIMSADSELVAAQNDIHRIELELQERLATVFRRYESARQQVDRYQKDLLPRAQTSLELVGQGYRAGQTSFLVSLTSQRTYIRVNLAYIDALSELRQSAALIDSQLLSDSLQTDQR